MSYDIIEFEGVFVIRRKFYGWKRWVLEYLTNNGDYLWKEAILNIPSCYRFATKDAAEARLKNFKILRGVEA